MMNQPEKHGWKLPIPRYDASVALHTRLSELGKAAEQECQDLIDQSGIMSNTPGDNQSRAARRYAAPPVATQPPGGDRQNCGSIYWVLLLSGRVSVPKPRFKGAPSGCFKGCPQGRPSVERRPGTSRASTFSEPRRAAAAAE